MLLIIKRFFNLNKSFQNEVPANVILLAYYKNITGLYPKKSTQLDVYKRQDYSNANLSIIKVSN